MLLAWICRAACPVQVSLENGFSGHSRSVGKEHSRCWTKAGRQVHLAYPSLIPDTLCALPGGMPVVTLPQACGDPSSGEEQCATAQPCSAIAEMY